MSVGVFVAILFAIVLVAVSGRFIITTDIGDCGQNYYVAFEVMANPINDVGGLLSVGEDLLVYFQWMSTALSVDLRTNQGSLKLRSHNPIEQGKWSSVVVDVHRRSLGLTVLGASHTSEHISFGHIHAPKELFYVVNNTIDTPADAVIRNLFITCSDRHSHSMAAEDSQSTMYSRLFNTLEVCGGAKRKASPYAQYKIMNVRTTTFNGTTDPYMVVHVIDAPPERMFNVRIKLRSQSSNSGFKYGFAATAIPVLKTYNLNRANNQKKFMHKELIFHNHSTTRELELSGYVGKNQIIPAANDYNMRIELVDEFFDPTTDMMVAAVVGCVRMKNMTIGDYDYSTNVLRDPVP